MAEEQEQSLGGSTSGTAQTPSADSVPEVELDQYDRDEADKVDPKMPEGTPNVRLAQSRKQDALPSGLVNIGLGVSIMIPKRDKQLAGFHVPDNGHTILVHQFPQYKFMQAKGTPLTDKPTTGQ